MNFIFPRKDEMSELNQISNSSKSEFIYVRGRRRIGKSWLLVEWASKQKNCLYFSGKKDASKQDTLQQFIQEWTRFSGSVKLLELKKELLSWDRVFIEILQYQKLTQKRLTLILDEIQWIAKDGSGFIGSLKSAWITFEMSRSISIIVCGSSNKFFSDHVGGEEKILRGIATRAPLWVHPIPLKDVRKYFFPKWNDLEVALTYMMVGGIPYYLQQINTKFGFIHAVNDALFSSDSIFINEIDEVLNLEFNKAGVRKAKDVLSTVGLYGCSQAKIRKSLGISSSSASEICDKLVQYNILFQDLPDSKKGKYGKGLEASYFMKDFYLLFYFSVLEKYKNRIARNMKSSDLIFSEILNKNGYYIENFTGKAFENLIYHLIETGNVHSKFFKSLKISSYDFDVHTYNDDHSQFDVIVRSEKDRLVRVIECKWGKENKDEIESLCKKEFPMKSTDHRLNAIIKAVKPSSSYLAACKKAQVTVITLADLM